MDGSCSKCGGRIESSWSYCPSCGTACATQANGDAPHEIPTSTPTEKTPVRGAFGGLLLGVICAPVLIMVGTLLLITGIGAFLGVPMLIAGVLAPLLGPMLGIGTLKGKCPWCGAAVSSIAVLDGFSCEACKHKIVVKKRELVRAA
jgi:DNA-directed RNA polymerase subunit RPC12/RpoP